MHGSYRGKFTSFQQISIFLLNEKWWILVFFFSYGAESNFSFFFSLFFLHDSGIKIIRNSRESFMEQCASSIYILQTRHSIRAGLVLN